MILRIRQLLISLKNHRGFTLMELCIVIATMSILATIGLKSYMDSRKHVVDAVALSEARGLGTAVYNVFLDQEDVDLSHLPGDGPRIGTTDNAGNPRAPVFIMSAAMEAQIIGSSDFGGTGRGKCDAWIWHPLGNKKYYLLIDEAAGISSFPTY